MQRAPVHPLILARLIETQATLAAKLAAERDAAVVPLEKALASLHALSETQDSVHVADFIEEYANAIAQLKALDMAALPPPEVVSAIGRRLHARIGEIAARAGLGVDVSAPR